MTTDLTPEAAATERPLLVRSALRPFHPADIPTYRYLRASDGAWVDFDDATRFDAATDQATLPVTTGSHAEASITWVRDLPRDLDDFPFDPNDGPYIERLTRCCAAACSISDGPLYCKSCFVEQGLDAATPPRLDANWSPGDGPIAIRLG
ncbi:hypothetical protein [Cellulosimicrobium sp. Marseille-Q4280]|uniref:hypothetical protein n=1 Tax=Cellulosimicrobium sp. Marseille-Q4280 TaxID=2937992 RepID=UPI00203AB440|nr:hypothetical protein [Cellulosimicrobium sp. Marseille-Q4280]